MPLPVTPAARHVVLRSLLFVAVFAPVLSSVLTGVLHAQIPAAKSSGTVSGLLAGKPAATDGVTTPGTDSLIASPAAVVSDSDLTALATAIRQVFETRIDAHQNGGAAEVAALARKASKAETDANTMVARLQPYEKIYQSFLALLGTAPAKDGGEETPEVAAQRDRLLKGQRDLAGRLMRARLYALEAHQLVVALSQRTDAAQQALLMQRFPSPLAPTFWARLNREWSDDVHHLWDLWNEFIQTVRDALKGDRLLVLLGCSGVAAALASAPFFLARQIRRASARLLAAGRARRLMSGLLFSIVCAACAAAAANVLWLGLTGGSDVSGSRIADLMDTLGEQLPLAAFALGAGIAILSPIQSEWRLAPLDDTLARALVPYTIWFAALVTLRGFLRYVDTVSGIGMLGVQVADAIFVFAGAPLLFMVPRTLVAHTTPDASEASSSSSDAAPERADTPVPDSDMADEDSGSAAATVKSAGAQDVQTQARLSSIGRLVCTVAIIVAAFCVLAVFAGYVPLGYATMTWICSMATALVALGLVFLLTQILGATVFVSTSVFGRRIVRLGVPSKIVDQASVIITGGVSVFLAFVAIAIAESGEDFEGASTLGTLTDMLLGPSIGGVSFSFGTILKCIALPVIGHYVIKVIQSWLKTRYFPTTHLDLGAQTSILSIFTYTAWIFVGLTVISSIGVTVQSMTWVVSALSVGIGFGLQSIVQNFVSGIILLAERPVTIGDLVEIGGAVGDIQRISVRSTDIKLADGSTMIVPNSQFITSAVRNATVGYPAGTLSVLVSLPLGTDLVRAIAVMSEALAGVPDLLKTPTPTVSVATIAEKMVTLSASGRTATPRNVATVANAARLAMWKALYDNGIVATITPAAQSD